MATSTSTGRFTFDLSFTDPQIDYIQWIRDTSNNYLTDYRFFSKTDALRVVKLEIRRNLNFPSVDDDYRISVNGISRLDLRRNLSKYDPDSYVWTLNMDVFIGDVISVDVFDGWASRAIKCPWIATLYWSNGETQEVFGGFSEVFSSSDQIPTYAELGLSFESYYINDGPWGTLSESTHYYDNGQFTVEYGAGGIPSGRLLEVPTSSVEVTYSFVPTTIEGAPEYLSSLLAAHVALEGCMALTGDGNKYYAMERIFKRALVRARAQDYRNYPQDVGYQHSSGILAVHNGYGSI
jgi:hypothetical protein